MMGNEYHWVSYHFKQVFAHFLSLCVRHSTCLFSHNIFSLFDMFSLLDNSRSQLMLRLKVVTILSITFIHRYKVISHMNIFFTCKNSLVMLLQMYRFCILCLATRPTRRRQSRIFSLLPQVSYETASYCFARTFSFLSFID